MTDSPPNSSTIMDGFINGWAPLTHEALLQLKGHDACKFLQGQTTADFAQAQALDVIAGAFCDVKGRVIADFRALVIEPEHLILRVSDCLADLLLAHLTKYLMFSKAELTRLPDRPWGVTGSEAWRHFGAERHLMTENRAEAVAQGWLIPVAEHAALLIPRDSSQMAPNPDATSAEDYASAWRAASCLRGEARITAATTGKYLPQDLSYDLAGWVSFDKGCYTGQEIIARLHWRGTPKRRLYLGKGAIPCPVEGLKLISEADSRTVGSVVNAANHAQGSVVLVEAVEAAAGKTVVAEDTKQAITLGDTPMHYSMESKPA